MDCKDSNSELHDGSLENLGRLNVVAQQLEETGFERKMVADETDSSTPQSSFQLSESRLLGSSSSTSAQTIDLEQTKQSSASHHLAPLSVSEDCLKQMQPVRPICRGDVCRRRLFSQPVVSDEVATIPVPVASKKARVEDYVDTFLLSKAAQKVRSLCQQELPPSNSLQLASNLVGGSSSFDWPTADLQAMKTSIPLDCYSLAAELQCQTNDDLDMKQYADVLNESRWPLFQQNIKNQNHMRQAKDMSNQFKCCGWAIKEDDCGCDRSHGIHQSSNFSKAIHAANAEGFPLLLSSPPDLFQSFDTTVSLFQT